MSSPENPQEVPSATVFISTPFGLVGQWLQSERWKRDDRAFCVELGDALNDWEGRWSMLTWITDRVIEDHAVANQRPRNYLRDVSLEYHLTYWFLTARLCYDTIAFMMVQMAADRDRGKLSRTSFHDLANDKERPTFQNSTNSLLGIVRESSVAFDELRTIRDSLVHFVGKAGNQVELPKRISITIPNHEGVTFIVERTRFASIYGAIEQWPVIDTLRKHSRCIYELAGRLECCYLDHHATDKLPGSYYEMTRTMFEFLDCAAWHEFSYPKWEKTAEDCH